jgi:hypothetical protein
MPELNSSAGQPEPQASPSEFDFIAPAVDKPRMKRRSLKPRQPNPLAPPEEPTPGGNDLAQEAPPRTEKTAPAGTTAPPEEEVKTSSGASMKESPAAKSPQASSRPIFASTTRPSSTSTPSPHGTRPATLYYSSSKPKEKEEKPASPMKSTTTAPSASPSPAVRPATVVDYRTNIDRQAREQKSVGGILSIIVYVLIGFFVVGAGLAGYGTYALSKQIKAQSLTIDELDKHYASETLSLAAQIKTNADAFAQFQTQTQAQLAREQELIVQQQETINKLIAADTAATAALRQERQARADETSALRARVRSLENRQEARSSSSGTTTQRY